MGEGVPYQPFYRPQQSPQESGLALVRGRFLEDINLMKVLWAMLAGFRAARVMNRDVGVDNRQ